MANAPFNAKAGITTGKDVLLSTAKETVKGTLSSGAVVNLIGTDGYDVTVGDLNADNEVRLYGIGLIQETPDDSYRVYTQGFKPTSKDIAMVTGSTNEPETLWVNSYGTAPAITEAPAANTAVVNLSKDAYKGLQLAASYGISENDLYFRTRSVNASAPKGQGLQNWKRIYHEGFKPSPSDIGALALTGGTVSGTTNFVGEINKSGGGDFVIKDQLGTPERDAHFYKNGEYLSIRSDKAADNDKLGGIIFKSATLLHNDNHVYTEANKPSLADLGAASADEFKTVTQSYVADIKKDTWCKILHSLPQRSLAGSFTLVVTYTRGNTVVNNTFIISHGHSAAAMIFTVGAHNYSNMKLRVVSAESGSSSANAAWVEIYDTNAYDFVTQKVNVSVYNCHTTITPITTVTETTNTAVLAQTTTEHYTLKMNDHKLYHEGFKPSLTALGIRSNTENDARYVNAINATITSKLSNYKNVLGNGSNVIDFPSPTKWFNAFQASHEGGAKVKSAIVNQHSSNDWYVGQDTNAGGYDWKKLFHEGNLDPTTFVPQTDIVKIAAQKFVITSGRFSHKNNGSFTAISTNDTAQKTELANAITVGQQLYVIHDGVTYGLVPDTVSEMFIMKGSPQEIDVDLQATVDKPFELYLDNLPGPDKIEVKGVELATAESLQAYVPKTGGEFTGVVGVDRINYKNGDDLYTQLLGVNAFGYQLSNESVKTSVNAKDGIVYVNSAHKVYHEGNKPTPIDVGTYSKAEIDAKVGSGGGGGGGATGPHYPSVGGGTYVTQTAVVFGYLKITLPKSWTNTMLTFHADVFNYQTGESSSFMISGYNYSTGTWANNPTAIQTTNGKRLPVQFGHDGSKCAIYIGASDTAWNYPQVAIRDVLTGFSGGTSDGTWGTGWNVDFTPSLGTITATVADPGIDAATVGGKTPDELASTVNTIIKNEAGVTFGVEHMPKQCGYRHMIYTAKDGYLYVSGLYASGNMPFGGVHKAITRPFMVMMDYTSGVKDYTCVHYDNYVLMNDGRLIHWGKNGYGQAGLGHQTIVNTPTEIATGVDEMRPPIQAQYNNDEHSLYYKKGATWYGQGGSAQGRMGDGVVGVQKTPKALSIPTGTIVDIWNFGGGYGSTFAKSSDGSIYATGHNTQGQLGVGDTAIHQTWTKVVGTDSIDFVELCGACGGYGGSGNSGGTLAARTADNKIYTWGGNQGGALGQGNPTVGFNQTSPKLVNLNFPVTNFVLWGGGNYPVFYGWNPDLNKIVVWGYNTNGQLGVGNTTHQHSPQYTDRSVKYMVTPSGGYTFGMYSIGQIIDHDNNIYSTGYDPHGAAGNGAQGTKTSWTKMNFFEKAGIKEVVQTYPDNGATTTFIIMKDGRLFGCGYGAYHFLRGMYSDAVPAINNLPFRIH